MVHSVRTTSEYYDYDEPGAVEAPDYYLTRERPNQYPPPPTPTPMPTYTPTPAQ